jgi:hypothetical protein
MELITDTSKPYVVFTSAKALMDAKLVPWHSLGGLKREEPKFTFRVMYPGRKDPVPFQIDPVRAMSVLTPQTQNKDSDMPNSWEAPVSDLPAPPGEPSWGEVFARMDREALATVTSMEASSYLGKEGTKWKNIPIPCLAEHYVKRLFEDMYNGLVEKKVGDKPLSEWSEEEKATISADLKAKLTAEDGNGKTKFKPCLNRNGGVWVGIKNFKKGAAVMYNDGPSPQTALYIAEGGKTTDRPPLEFIADTTYGDGTNNANQTSIDMDMVLEHKHVFAMKGMITNGWQLVSVTYKKPRAAGAIRRRTVFADDDTAEPASPPKKPRLSEEPEIKKEEADDEPEIKKEESDEDAISG